MFNSRGLPYTYDGFSTLWQRVRKESGIQDARIHDVRAKAITDAEELGMDAQTPAGHASRTTTEGYIRRRKAFIADLLPLLKRAKKRGEKAQTGNRGCHRFASLVETEADAPKRTMTASRSTRAARKEQRRS
jgi:hypothetical protein